MDKRLVVLSLAVGFLTMSVWGTQVIGATDCGEPVPAPKYQVGEKWTWRDEKGRERTREVIQVEGDIAQIRWSNGDLAYFDKDWIVRKVVRANGEVLTKQGAGLYTTIGEKLLDFPLQVGKRWERSYMGEPAVGGGGFRTYYRRYRVLSCEKISISAGEFAALKIEVEENIQGGRYSGVFHQWWSPEVKNFVKTQYVPSQWWSGGIVFDSELIRFQMK